MTYEITGGTVQIDEQDLPLVRAHKWRVSDTGYAVRFVRIDGRLKTIRLHRIIAATPAGMFTDHRNHDRLDNRRANLRVVTPKENSSNYKGARGYCYLKKLKKWEVRYRSKLYGRYATEEEAARAYQLARSGVPKVSKVHPRRRYLPPGVYYNKSKERTGKPYFSRPMRKGAYHYLGYFSIPQGAEAAYLDFLSKERCL